MFINYSFSKKKKFIWMHTKCGLVSALYPYYILCRRDIFSCAKSSKVFRYKRENIMLMDIIPRPHEPKLNINSFLKLLVDEFQDFWTGVELTVCTESCKITEIVKAAILCITCDMPAGRKVCGFLGHTTT